MRPGAPAWLAAAWAAPIAAGLELCRGFSASHVASLVLAVIVALGAARVRDAVEVGAGPCADGVEMIV